MGSGLSTTEEYATRYGVSVCLVTFLLGMSVPARTALRTYLDQMLDTLEGKADEWIASQRRAGRVHSVLLSQRDAVNAKLEVVRRASAQIPVDKITESCAASIELVDVVVKGVSSLGVEGLEDLQTKADSLLYDLSRLDVVSTGLARAKDSIDSARSKIDRWISLIDAMPS